MTHHYPFLLWFSTAFSLLGAFQFGFQLAVLNPSLHYVKDSLHFTDSAFVVSSVLVGAFFGALAAGNIADKLGPKRATIFNTVFLALGTFLSMVSTSVQTMVVGRLISGVGTGAASLLVPRYLSEIAPTRIRGLLGTMNQICINLGIVCAFALGWPYESGVPSITLLGRYTVAWWRCMFAVGLIPASLQAIGMLFCPETPVWLLWSGLHLQASASYRALHGSDNNRERNYNSTNATAGEGSAGGTTAGGIVSEVEAPLLEDDNYNVEAVNNGGDGQQEGGPEDSGGFAALFNPKYRMIMILALGLPLLQQFGGINTVILYGSEVFQKAGLKSPIAANLIMGFVNMAGTGIAAALMDKAGRKALLTCSFGGMAVALGCMAAFLLLPTPEHLAGPVSFFGIMAYIIAFALGCGPVPWVYLPEILPAEIKGPAQALCTAVNWLGNLAVGASFPAMLRYSGLGGSYAVYAVLCAVAALFCGRYMVETKQRSLAAVHAELTGAGFSW